MFLTPVAAQAQEASVCPISKAQRSESWEHDCDAAIQVEQDPANKAQLLFRRAYVLNERQAYEQSLEDLNAACALVPHHVAYLHERAGYIDRLNWFPAGQRTSSLDPRCISPIQ
jgi:hypothetical protein